MKYVAMTILWGVVLLSCSQRAVAEEAAVTVAIDSATTLAKTPDDFIGFGYETSAAAQPNFFSANNPRMIALYGNLTHHGLIRIGGNISDHTRYIAGAPAVVKSQKEVTIINHDCLTNLADFCRATGWKVMWGLNLGTGTEAQAVEEALAVHEALGASLQSFQIGNEVDLMPRYAKNYDGYHADYLEWKTAIRRQLPDAAFSGPDSANSFDFVSQFLSTESGDLKLATHHYYRGDQSNPLSTIDRLLQTDERFDGRLQKLSDLCNAHHIQYRINEVNSYSGGGKKGVSDTFASALWCLDYLFRLSTHGCAGANIETDINQHAFISFYSPIVHDAAGLCSARPEYYGMLAFAMAGQGEQIKTTLKKADINLTAYATRDHNGAVLLTMINKDLSHDANVECPVPAGCTAATADRLIGPSIDATTGVTFTGSSVAEDGTWSPGPSQAVTISGGLAKLSVPHASAAVIRFVP